MEPPLICTFYSLKGDVGCTTVLAHTALTLSGIRVVLKQALRSEKLVHFLAPGPDMYIDNWPTESLFGVWNALVGERMKGSNAAFSRNWVWNRLADGNDDRIPAT